MLPQSPPDAVPSVSSPSAILCTCAALFGLLAAVVLSPDSLVSADSLQLPASCLAAALVFGPLVSMIRDSRAILHPTSLMLLGLCYWILLDLVQALHSFDQINPAAVPGSFMAIALFASGLSISHFLPPLKFPATLGNAASLQFDSKLMLKVSIVAFALSFLRFAIPSNFDIPAMFEALKGNRWSAPWARGQLGGWDAFIDHLAYFGYFLPTISAAIYRLDKRVSGRLVLSILLAVTIAMFIAQGGGRRTVGAMVLSASVFLTLTSKHPLRTMAKVILAVIPLLLTFLQAILFARGSGYEDLFDYLSSGETLEGGVRVDDNFIRLSQIIEIIPAHAAHTGFRWVVWVLSRPIPRVFWEGKPIDPGFDLPVHLGMEGVSLSSSIVGESYMAFGYFGCVVIGVLYGAVGRGFKEYLDRNGQFSGLVIYTAGLLALFVGLRSGIELVLFSYVILAWIAAVSIIRRFR